MSKKYKILICFSILAAFFGFYAFNNGETRLTSKPQSSPVKKESKIIALQKRAKNEDMVAAILIMPKSYLPALKRFSQSAMARDITILRAQLEEIDGKMTAVQQNSRSKKRDRAIEPAHNPTNETTDLTSRLSSDQEKQVLSTGFLYLLAGIQKTRFIH